MTDAPSRLSAALADRYRLERKLGEGGMATVYLAHDLRHERKVALKILKPELAAVVGADRFLSEIKTTANLQHPHILGLHDSGEADGLLFYVMPYVEGETLRERLDRERQLPVDEAVLIAKNVAEALDYAHGKGIVHRDIKPANILLQSGKPVVSDFGIALAVGAAGGGRLTETGLSLGTPHYMSPEQATGDVYLGPATDIYALGCVLYEMLVGEPPYTGGTAQAVLGKIVTGEADPVTKHRGSVPANVDAAIRKALEKLPADRFAASRDFAQALTDRGFHHGERAGASSAAGAGPSGRLTLAIAVLIALAVGASAGALTRPSPPLPVARFDLTPPASSTFVDDLAGIVLDISPDGQRVVYVGPAPEGTMLWQRSLSSMEPTPIPGTEGADNPVFSPDGLSVAFWDDGDVKVTSLRGGPVTTVVSEVVGSRYIDWGDDGMIYFASGAIVDGFVTFRVPSSGEAPPQQVSELALGAQRSFVPEVLPDGRGLLVTDRRARRSEATISVVGPNGGRGQELFRGVSARFAASGHIVYATTDHVLMAVPFDLNSLTVTGPHVPVLDDLFVREPGPGAGFALSKTGNLVYRTIGGVRAAEMLQLARVDLDGTVEALALAPRDYQSVAWHPNGRTVAYSSAQSVFTYDVAVGTTPRRIAVGGLHASPVFSPDGRRIVTATQLANTAGWDLVVRTPGGPAIPLTSLEGDEYPVQWPLDTLIVFERMREASADLWILNLSDPDNPVAEEYLSSEADLRGMVVSPDGTLAAYRSNESGQNEIYLRSFPAPGVGTLLSDGDDARFAYWSPDGTTLYYARGDGAIVAARLERDPDPVVVSRVELFTFPGLIPNPGSLHPSGNGWIARQRVGTPDAEVDPPRLVLVQNFFEELKRLAPN